MDDDELTKWEYTIEDVQNIQRMNQLGSQGWELVSAGASGGGILHEGILKRKQSSKQNQSNSYGRGY